MKRKKRCGGALVTMGAVLALAAPGSALAASENASCLGQNASAAEPGAKGEWVSNAARNGGFYFGKFISRVARQDGPCS